MYTSGYGVSGSLEPRTAVLVLAGGFQSTSSSLQAIENPRDAPATVFAPDRLAEGEGRPVAEVEAELAVVNTAL